MDHVNNAVYADWLDEAVIDAGDPRGDASDPAPASGWSTRCRPSRARPSTRVVWPDDDGWSFRLLGADGNDLLRARLEGG